MRSAGFTIIELLVTIAVLAILLYIAVPNFAVWMQNTQIRTAGEAILNGVQLARAEAIRRNVNVELRMDASSGWTARVADTGEMIQSRVAGEGSATAVVTITPAGAKTVTFNGFGSYPPTGNADGTPMITEIKIDSSSIPAADSRELCVMVRAGGNVRLCDPQVPATDTRTCIPPLPAAQVVPAGCT